MPMREPTRRPPKRWMSSTEKRGQRRFCALPPRVSPRQTTRLRTTYAATPEARAAYQMAGFEVTCMPAPALSSRLPTRRSRRSRRRAPTKRPAMPRASSHPARCAEQEAGLRGDVGARQLAPEAVTCSHGESLGPPVAVSTRCAPRDAVPLVARPPETTRIGAVRRERDVDRAAHGEVAADRDEARPVERRGGRVDRERLDDAVQVERQARRAREQPARTSTISVQRPQSVGSTSPSVSRGDVERHAQRPREERRHGEHPRRPHGSRGRAPTRGGRG